MKILIFDTETTGLPKYDMQLKRKDYSEARLVQLSYIIIERNNTDKIIKVYNQLVKNISYKCSEKAYNVHNISDEYRNANGIPTENILNEFVNDVNNCDLIVSHGLDFDIPVISNEINIINKNKQILQLPTKIRTFDTKNTDIYKKCRTNLFNTVLHITKLDRNGLINKIITKYHLELNNKEEIRPHNALFDTYLCYELFYYENPI